MTLLEVIDGARFLANEPLDSSRTFPDNTSSFWTDRQLITYHNMVQSDVQNEIIQSYEDYFVTSTFLNIISGCTTYVLPARFIKVRRLEDTRNVTDPNQTIEIMPVTINETYGARAYFNNASGTTTPLKYYLQGNTIRFMEAPRFTDASAIQLHYIRALADVTAASDSSEIPVEHHKLLVFGIYRYMLLQQQSDTARADLEYEKWMQKLKMQCEDRQVQRPRKVKSSGLRGRII